MPSSNSPPVVESLSDFAIRVYAKPDCKRMCLTLQDAHGVNVLGLLWVLWLEYMDLALPLDELAAVNLWLNETSEQKVHPLRNARKKLQSTGSSDDLLEQRYLEALNKELQAELAILERLDHMTQTLLSQRLATEHEDPATITLESYLANYGKNKILSYPAKLRATLV